MRPRWLVELEGQIKRLYEATQLREDLWPIHPGKGQERAIVIVPGKVLFTLANVPEKIDGK